MENSTECFKEGEWVVLQQLTNKRLARIGRKGFAVLGKDCVSLEGAIGCLPWTNFKMEPQSNFKHGKKMFNLVPAAEDDSTDLPTEEAENHSDEDRDNRSINDDGQSQSLSSLEIEALREGGLTGKEIVNQLVAGSATYDRKTKYAQSKYLRKKASKHCLRERVCIRKTSLSCVAEVLCNGGGGEGSRGSIIGMRPDTLSQMITALNIQWKKKVANVENQVMSFTAKNSSGKDITTSDEEMTMVHNEEDKSSDVKEPLTNVNCSDIANDKSNVNNEGNCKFAATNFSCDSSQGTTYVVYESGNWGLLVASLLTLLPSPGPKLIHLYPGHGVPCLIAPRALNLTTEKLSILSSVNLKALLQKLRKSTDSFDEEQMKDCIEEKSKPKDFHAQAHKEECETVKHENEESLKDKVLEEKCDGVISLESDNWESSSKKRKLENSEESADSEIMLKKPRWDTEAELAATILTSCKIDGLVVVASREHPVSIVLSLLPYLAPSRPLVVYCPYREPLLDLYAVLKGWEPWVGRYGGKNGILRVANLRVTENWLRNYQVLPSRTHPEVNMSPGGGFVLTGTVIDFGDA